MALVTLVPKRGGARVLELGFFVCLSACVHITQELYIGHRSYFDKWCESHLGSVISKYSLYLDKKIQNCYWDF